MKIQSTPHILASVFGAHKYLAKNPIGDSSAFLRVEVDEGGVLSVSGTDLQNSIVSRYQLSNDFEEGGCVVFSDVIINYLAKLPELTPVTFESFSDGSIEVSTPNGSLKINSQGLEMDDVQVHEVLCDTKYLGGEIVLTPKAWEVIKGAMINVGTISAGNPIYDVVCFTTLDDTLIVKNITGISATKAKVHYDEEITQFEKSALVMSDTIRVVGQFVKLSEDGFGASNVLTMSSDGKRVRFTYEDLETGIVHYIFGALFDGMYPDISQIESKVGVKKVVIEKKPFIQLLQRVESMAKNDSESFRASVGFNATRSMVEVSTYETEVGEVSESMIPAEVTDVASSYSDFHLKFFTDMVKKHKDDQVSIFFPEEELRPIKIRSGDDVVELNTIIMPLRKN